MTPTRLLRPNLIHDHARVTSGDFQSTPAINSNRKASALHTPCLPWYLVLEPSRTTDGRLPANGHANVKTLRWHFRASCSRKSGDAWPNWKNDSAEGCDQLVYILMEVEIKGLLAKQASHRLRLSRTRNQKYMVSCWSDCKYPFLLPPVAWTVNN
jgi:hypothetical protein